MVDFDKESQIRVLKITEMRAAGEPLDDAEEPMVLLTRS